ncbi:hypothetical protein NKI48_13715 [Mesorhizobium sp. M0644]|uniref:hypothetical protein n=1 Tax=unclassified Mesorhizobium TaxID=325217 RepID=UPI00333B5B23
MVDDPSSYTAGLQAAKLAFDTVRGAFGMMKDVKDAMPKGDNSSAVTLAIEKSERQFAIAEAELAKGLGYQLCKCEFPPTIMLTVGYGMGGKTTPVGDGPVHECPKCGITTAGVPVPTATVAIGDRR